MLRSLRDLIRFTLVADQSNIGTVRDFLIDTFNWLVRYVVVELDDRTIVLSTTVMERVEYDEKVLSTHLDRFSILDGPVIDLDRPLTRADEQMLQEHYGWDAHWKMEDVSETLPGDQTEIPLIDMAEEAQDEAIPVTGETSRTSYLHSAKDLFGSDILTRNERAGSLVDVVFQESDWDLHYLVVDLGGLLPGKKVLVSPQWVQEVDQDRSRMLVDLDKEVLRKSREFASSKGIVIDD